MNLYPYDKKPFIAQVLWKYAKDVLNNIKNSIFSELTPILHA